jgi:hypothetical protein
MDAQIKFGYLAVMDSPAVITVYYNPLAGIVAGNGMASAVEKDIGCLDDDTVAGGSNILRQQYLYSGVSQLAGAVAAGIAGFLGLDPIGQAQEDKADEDSSEKSVGEGRLGKTVTGTWHFKSPYCHVQGTGFELKGMLPMTKITAEAFDKPKQKKSQRHNSQAGLERREAEIDFRLQCGQVELVEAGSRKM